MLCPPVRLGHRFRTIGVSTFWKMNVSVSFQKMMQTKGVTKNTHIHKWTYMHIQGHGMGRDMSFVYGQAMESMDRVYKNIGIHRYTRSCTQGQTHIPSTALPPRARANLSSILKQ